MYFVKSGTSPLQACVIVEVSASPLIFMARVAVRMVRTSRITFWLLSSTYGLIGPRIDGNEEFPKQGEAESRRGLSDK
jgi:hypothetical protein